MYQKQILMEKLKEATASVLPISLIVMAISFVLVPVDAGLMLSFVIATAMLILGMGLFTLGADMSMSRIGNYMGSKLTKSRKLPLILTVSFALGVAITVAEPDLQVLAGNVPEIDTTVLILTVSVGVGFFLMLCMVRILFSISLRTMLIVFYAIVFAAAFLSDESILSVAFDSGGVTTGPMTVPFIMALGVGVASIRSDENAKADSFGLVGLCSIGPILSVLLLGAIYKTQPAQGESGTVSGVATTVELGKDYLHALPEYLWEVTMALLPIVVFFLIFQVISLKLRKLPFMRIVIGILYTYLGLVLFLTGVNVGFSPLGYALGAALAEGWKVYLLAPLAMLMGWFIINAEPAVHTLNKQVEELSAGAISAKAMGMSLSIAVSAAGGLAMLRVITGISIMYFLVPGYLIALALSFFVPRTFTAIAFDSGGVASGPLTATFMLPFATGACEALGGNVMTDAFGLVALVAMMPLITVQVMGAIYVVKSRHASQEPQLPDFAINDAWPHDGQLPGRITGLPDLVDFFCHQLADSIRRVGSWQSLLRLKVLRRAIGCNGAGEQDLPDAVFFRKCGHIFRAPDICFKIGFFRVAGGAVDRCQIKNHVLRSRNELKIDGLAHIQPDILHPIVLFHNARHHALFPGHHKI